MVDIPMRRRGGDAPMPSDQIESLIGELERLRDFVRQEGMRLQREIDGYARLSEEATKSTRIIAESVAQWKSALEQMSIRRD
jgi:hypothetical protein